MAPWSKARLILELQTPKTRKFDTYKAGTLFSVCHVRIRYCLDLLCHVVGHTGSSNKCKNFRCTRRCTKWTVWSFVTTERVSRNVNRIFIYERPCMFEWHLCKPLLPSPKRLQFEVHIHRWVNCAHNIISDFSGRKIKQREFCMKRHRIDHSIKIIYKAPDVSNSVISAHGIKNK